MHSLKWQVVFAVWNIQQLPCRGIGIHHIIGFGRFNDATAMVLSTTVGKPAGCQIPVHEVLDN